MNWMPKIAFTFENMRPIRVGGRMTVSKVKSLENILAFALVFFLLQSQPEKPEVMLFTNVMY